MTGSADLQIPGFCAEEAILLDHLWRGGEKIHSSAFHRLYPFKHALFGPSVIKANSLQSHWLLWKPRLLLDACDEFGGR